MECREPKILSAFDQPAHRRRRPSRRRLTGRSLARGLGIALLAGLTAACSIFEEESDPFADAGIEITPIPYQTKIEGNFDSSLGSLLERSSRLITFKDRPVGTQIQLQRRAEGDVERLTAVLRSEGYYDGTVSFDIEVPPDAEDDSAIGAASRAGTTSGRSTAATSSADPANVPTGRAPSGTVQGSAGGAGDTTPAQPSASETKVTLTVETGQRYKFDNFDIVWADGIEPALTKPIVPRELGYRQGKPARAPLVVQAEGKLIDQLESDGHPLAKVDNRRVVIDREQKTMDVTLTVDAGALAAFGPTRIAGQENVKLDYLEGLVPWSEGERWNQELVEEGRANFANTGLFRSITMNPAPEVAADGELPIDIQLAERPPRSIGGGVDYSTAEGPGGDLFWEHRNMFGRDEDLRVNLRLSNLEQSLGYRFRKPDFLERDQILFSNARFLHENTEAYEQTGFISEPVGIERPLSDTWTGRAAISFEATRIDDKSDESKSEDFILFGLPLSARQDTTDDLLNPTRGYRLTLGTTPYTGNLEEVPVFLTNEVTGSTYFALDNHRRLIFATRARLGSILAESRNDLPATKRFYAGGGGSVRGYEYQTVGPLDSDDNPIGGRSVAELSVELRWRFYDDFGIVPFIDGGQVYESIFPTFDEDFLWAGGLGFRYYTAIGPARVDFAFPINGRERDSIWQFYVSIGQAF